MSIDTHHLWRHRGPAGILSIAQCHLTTPARVTIAGEKPAAGKVPRVRQVAYLVPRAHKPAVLDRVLDMENLTSVLVFCRTRLEVLSLEDAQAGRRRRRHRSAMTKKTRTAVTAPTATDVFAWPLVAARWCDHLKGTDADTTAFLLFVQEALRLDSLPLVRFRLEP